MAENLTLADNRLQHSNIRKRVAALYQQIWEKGRTAFLAGGEVDAQVRTAAQDERYSLVVLIRMSPEITAQMCNCLQRLQAIEPGLYAYPPQDMHITVMDILKGELHRPLPQQLAAYQEAVQDCAAQIPPFDIVFKGLTASAGAIMATGYYEQPLETFRVALRHTLAERGLALEERYPTYSAHVTLARFPQPLQHAAALADCWQHGADFGTLHVTQLEFAFHNWYDTQKQLLAMVPLASRELI